MKVMSGYEESVISGVLQFRTSPDGDWRPFSAAALTARLVASDKDNERLMDNLVAGLTAAYEYIDQLEAERDAIAARCGLCSECGGCVNGCTCGEAVQC